MAQSEPSIFAVFVFFFYFLSWDTPSTEMSVKSIENIYNDGLLHSREYIHVSRVFQFYNFPFLIW